MGNITNTNKKKSKVFNVPIMKTDIEVFTNEYQQNIMAKAFKFHQEGDLESASKLYKILIDQGFCDAGVLSNYAVIQKQKGQLSYAKELYLKSIRISPKQTEAYANLGLLYTEIENFKEALKYTKKAIKLKQDDHELLLNLGYIYKEINEIEHAEIANRKAIRLKPECEISHNNLGIILIELGKLKEAEIHLRDALRFNPKYADAYHNLGTLLFHTIRIKEAISSYEMAIKLRPDYIDSYSSLGELFLYNQDFIHSINVLNKGLKIDPNDSDLNICFLKVLSLTSNWDELDQRLHLVKDLSAQKTTAIEPLTMMYLEDDPEREFHRSLNFHRAHYYQKEDTVDYKKKDKIRIGYFSNSFYSHSSLIIFCRIIELHNKDEFEIYIYDFGHHEEDLYTQRVQAAATQYKNVQNLSDLELINVARVDQIDIAFDLMGYTRKNRAKIFSKRLAPIQVSYLDWPGGTGNQSIDYLIADQTLIPIEDEKYYAEKIIRMPHAKQPTDDTLIKSDKKFSRSNLGISENSFVFCCFSKSNKIQRQDFILWMNLLLKVEHSCLWLLESNEISKSNMIQEAKNMGIDTQRIIFTKKIPLRDHMSRQSCADLMLDTFNFSSGVMTCLAIKCCLPVLTLPGKTFSSRLSASILNSLNLKELIALDEKDYLEKALHLSTNNNINKLKEKILKLEQNSPYFNSQTYCNDFEKLLKNLIGNIDSD